MHTPFFPAFRPRLAALGLRSLQSLRQSTLHQLGQRLRGMLPDELLAPQERGGHSRQREYSLGLTLQCFVWQMLNPETACREVVRQVQALCRLAGRAVVDEGTSAYIQARSRLPFKRLRQLLEATAQAAGKRADQAGDLSGRPVKVVDGSTVQLADTSKNQAAYPQSGEQKPGCGFPVMKLSVLFSLASGAVLQVAQGNLHCHDLRLFRRLWKHLRKGDVLLGDRAYGDYATLAALAGRGVDVVSRAHQRRKVDFRKALQLGKHDGLFVWKRGYYQKKNTFSRRQWAALPEEITVRMVRFQAVVRGFRTQHITLTTTLLDPVAYPAQALIDLYGRRWRLELCLRDLKTTMGMEALRCKSPQMAQKELMAYLIAHNLVRCVMAEAAGKHDAQLDRISFKGAVDGLRQYSAAIDRARNETIRRALWEDLLMNLVLDQVPLRPGRQEPRAVKKRPKPFPLLNRPRRKYKETFHRNRYRKNNTQNKH